jgi:ParB family chromosome partitioning protein
MRSHRVVTLPISKVEPMPDNSNVQDDGMLAHLNSSIAEFGNVQALVVRPIGRGRYQVISGDWCLKVLQELGFKDVQCVVVQLDARAKLLAHALNSIHGEDDPGLKAESFRVILDSLPRESVLKIIPESEERLNALTSLGEIDLASHLQLWQQAQSARLRHLTLQLTPSQLEVVEEALSLAGQTKSDENPNARGNAIFKICQSYIQRSRGTK